MNNCKAVIMLYFKGKPTAVNEEGWYSDAQTQTKGSKW